MKKQDIFNWITIAQSGCWEWQRALDGRGYGVACVPRAARAHRVAYEVAVGPIPDGQNVCHRCDNPRCINPSHLFVGSQADNMADMAEKGRGAKPPVHRGQDHWRHKYPEKVLRGADNPLSKLTDAEVIAIRLAYIAGEPRQSLADRFGLSVLSLSDITSGRTWRHLLNTGPTLEQLHAAKRTAPAAKLTHEAVRNIKALIAEGASNVEIATRFGIHKTTVSDIKRGKIWLDV